MLNRCYISHAPSRRNERPNIAKLLYGKRKNALHGASKAKPTVVGMLLQVPIPELHSATRRAAGMNELSNEAISEVLRKCRALNRFDRSEIVVEAVDEAKLKLTSSHYCTLMAHANDNRDSKNALRYWERACREKKANSKLHGALLATYRSSGLWKDAVRHYAAMIDDKMGCDPYALHTVMNACRRAGAVDVGLAVFSKAVQNEAAPNSTVYLELLRCMQQTRSPNRWEMSLSVLQSLGGTVDVTAGLYNATISTMAGALWEKGVEVFQAMKENNVQPSRDTLATLVSLNPNNTSHVVRCVTEAHLLGMPVTDSMYRAVLTNLTRLKLDHEAVRFAAREYSRSTEDPGNPVNSTLALGLAILDMLLAHSRPKDAMLFFNVFESQLGNIVSVSTRGLGTVGLRSQRWIVQGRVAVLDHNIILNPRFESLLSHYDSLLVPLSSIRLLVRRVKEESGTVKGSYTKHMLKRLQKLLEDHPAVRVLPLTHQLNAHTYIVDGPITPESVELLRKTVSEPKEGAHGAAFPLVIRKRGDFPNTLETLQDFSPKKGMEVAAMRGEVALHNNEPRLLKYPDRITAPERVLAVAAMLKSLNPDTSVHVLSTTSLQLQVVENWNKLRPFTGLTAVRYPDEVELKAPGEQRKQPKHPAGAVSSGLRHETDGPKPGQPGGLHMKRLFVPS